MTDSDNMPTASDHAAHGPSDITLEGVRVNNLRGLNVRIKRNSLTVICGVSGSGKSSFAFDTLFAEGQRRYIETFSPYARQFLDQVERPDVDRIDGIPPAIAIRQNVGTRSAHSTVGTRTEILEYLRILFARLGTVFCKECDAPATTMTPDLATDHLRAKWPGRRAMLVVSGNATLTVEDWMTQGFVRCIYENSIRALQDCTTADPTSIQIIVDRVRIANEAGGRISESLEQAFVLGQGSCCALIESNSDDEVCADSTCSVDGEAWHLLRFTRGLSCLRCGRSFTALTPDRLNFQSAVGACPSCEGTGQQSGLAFEKVVPNQRMSLKEGAIQPWTTPAYRHELDELLALAPDYGIPVDVPFAELDETHLQRIHDGVPDRDFGGLVGFHRWLVRNRYKQGVSVFLNRWRSWNQCSTCDGNRLVSDGEAVRIAGCTLPEVCAKELSNVTAWLDKAIPSLPNETVQALATPVRQLRDRLGFLEGCGLGYLSLDRSMKTLSGGEAQRVVLTSSLGSGLVNTLYVLDEPTSGLHSSDTAKVIAATRELQRSGNTVVVVEHDPEFITAGDEVIEIGPGAGDEGGEIVFYGTPEELLKADTVTARELAAMTGRNSDGTHTSRKTRTPAEWIEFKGVTSHNVDDLSGRLPLNCICVVKGVSGSGKSSLIVDALYPEMCRALGRNCALDSSGSVKNMSGTDAIDEVLLLDQSPLPRSRRSIPATVIGAFDEIRSVMSATHEAKKRNYTPGMFSFNSTKGGRCSECEGHGIVTIEMQFLADIQTTCQACSGRRFRPDVLEVRFRDRSIDDVLNMTVEDGFSFFGGHRKIQQRLNALRQAGLNYIRLGQPVSTLSGGECQRLRIAALLAGVPLDDGIPTAKRAKNNATNRTLFILDEPSTGLHMSDIAALMTCLNHLVEIGHSVIVIEHDDAVVRQADFVIEMGPGPGRLGGSITSAGMGPN